MAIAITLQEYLDRCSINYDVVSHPYSVTSMNTAQAAGVSGETVAKSVVVEDGRGFLMAVLPATHRIQFGRLNHLMGRPLELATEQEISSIFPDCDLGAVPPIGQAYGMDVVMDDCLRDRDDIYFESGDHQELIHMRGEEFQKMMAGNMHGDFSRHI